MIFTYTNKVTGERTKRENLNHVGEAWALCGEVCQEMNWNENMFAEDVEVRSI